MGDNTMNDDSMDNLERQLAQVQPIGAPAELRGSVLAAAHRELAASRWDRRLARATVVLLLMGIGLNAAIGLRPSQRVDHHGGALADDRSRQSLVETAVVVAEATNAETGRQFARQMAAMRGRDLSAEEAAAIDAAINGESPHPTTNGDKG
jgi:hypothetical protein